MNQSIDSGHSKQSGATNEVLRSEFSRAWRCKWIFFSRLATRLECFPVRDALNPFGLDGGLFSLTTNHGFLSSYLQTNVSLFIQLPAKKLHYNLGRNDLIRRWFWSNEFLYCNLCIQFLIEKKLADPFSFASGSQDVTQSNLNQTKWLLN